MKKKNILETVQKFKINFFPKNFKSKKIMVIYFVNG